MFYIHTTRPPRPDKHGHVVLVTCKKELPIYDTVYIVAYTGQVNFYTVQETHGHE